MNRRYTVVEEPKAGTSRDSSSPALILQIFALFKDYLATQLDTQGKKPESKQKIDKETVELKYKGNQKQFRVNAELENILEQIHVASVAIFFGGLKHQRQQLEPKFYCPRRVLASVVRA